MSRFPAPLALLASAQKSIRRDARSTSPCIAMHLLLPLFGKVEQSRVTNLAEGPSSTTSLFADKSLWYTLQRLKSTHTQKKVRFVCWTHRQNMPTTRPTITVNLFTIFIGTRAVCAENTKLQPLTRGIPNVEPDRALTPLTRTTKRHAWCFSPAINKTLT